MSKDTGRTVVASVLGSVALLPLLVLPGMVGGLVDFAGFSDSEAGWVASAGFAGGAIGSIFAGLRIRHMDPRQMAIAGLLMLALFDGLSVFVGQLPTTVFVAFRLLAGIGGMVAYGAVMATIAALSSPERGYGIFMVFQFGISGLGLWGLPYVLPVVGVPGMFAIFSGLAVASYVLRGAVIHRSGVTDGQGVELHAILKPTALLMLFGIGLYETANLMHYAYGDRIGLTFDLSNYEIGRILGTATFLGVPAAFIVVWIGDRFGQLQPLAFALAVSVVGMLILLYPFGPVSYRVSMYTMGSIWAVGLPYFYAIGARIDPGGSVVVVAGFFTSLGATLGPALSALLVRPGYYDDIILGAIGIYGLVAAMMTICVTMIGNDQA
jgi:hypothetical protein